MIRTSLPAAVAAACLSVIALGPLVARALGGPELKLIPPNEVGTWRLDSLLDQARVEGTTASDVDPGHFVLQSMEFANGDHGVRPAAGQVGQGFFGNLGGIQVQVGPGGQIVDPGNGAPSAPDSRVERTDGAIRLSGKGAYATFSIPLTENVASADVGLVALEVRAKGIKQFALLTETVEASPQRGGGQGGGPGGPGVIVPVVDPQAAPPPPPAPPTTPPAPKTPPAGAQAGAGAQAPAPRPPPNMMQYARRFLGNSMITLTDDGEWHPVARTLADLDLAGGMFGMGRQRSPIIKGFTLALVSEKDDGDIDGGSLELRFVHLLSRNAQYAHAAAGATVLDLAGVLHSGLFMNTPCVATYRLVVPERGHVSLGLSSSDATPFVFAIHVSSPSGRKTVFKTTMASEKRTIEPVDVDLSAFAGQDVQLTLEAVEKGSEGTVCFLLQPLVYGARKEGVRNVLLYFCDTLRSDGLSCYGNTRGTTPTLDALANDGIRFEHCYSQGAWTYVSMPSSLSSLMPTVSGVRTGSERLADSVTTVAEAFRAKGYVTAAFVRNDFVGKATHTDQGFDFFYTGAACGAVQQQSYLAKVMARQRGSDGAGNTMDFSSGSSRDIYNAFEPWLEKHGDAPFFVLLHTVDPHEPYDPEEGDWTKYITKEDRKRFDDEESKLGAARMQQMNGGMRQQAAPAPAAATPAVGAGAGGPQAPAATVAAGNPPPAAPPAAANPPTAKPQGNQAANPPPTPVVQVGRPNASLREEMKSEGIDPDAHIAVMRALYDAEVAYMDRHLKLVLELLDKKGLSKSTVFSFNADHGEEFLEHGGLSHGQSSYAELTHVPWILRAPGVLPAGKILEDNVANLDIGPTLLGLCGFAPPEEFMGRNLSPQLRSGEELPPTRIVTEQWGGPGGFGAGTCSIIEGRWKTIVHHPLSDDASGARPALLAGAQAAPEGPDLEIFDLLADGKDRKSLLEEKRDVAEAAKRRLEAWLKELDVLHKKYATDGPQGMTPEAAANLRALGYLR